jgi:hypothetical protein
MTVLVNMILNVWTIPHVTIIQTSAVMGTIVAMIVVVWTIILELGPIYMEMEVTDSLVHGLVCLDIMCIISTQ